MYPFTFSSFTSRFKITSLFSFSFIIFSLLPVTLSPSFRSPFILLLVYLNCPHLLLTVNLVSFVFCLTHHPPPFFPFLVYTLLSSPSTQSPLRHVFLPLLSLHALTSLSLSPSYTITSPTTLVRAPSLLYPKHHLPKPLPYPSTLSQCTIFHCWETPLFIPLPFAS